MVIDGHLPNRRYKKALKFLRKQHKLRVVVKDRLREKVECKMKADPTWNDDDDSKQIQDETQVVNAEDKESLSRLESLKLKQNMYWFIAVLHQHTDRRTVFRIVCI